MTRKVKALLALVLIAAIVGMGYSFQDSDQARALIKMIKGAGVSADEELDIQDLASPHYIIAGDGTYEYRITDKYASLPDEVRLHDSSDTVYDSFLRGISNVISSGVEIEAIEDAEKVVSEAVSKKSITALFDYEITVSEFFAFNGVKCDIPAEADKADRIILIEDGSILLCRNTTGEYYRLKSKADSDMKQRLADLMEYIFTQSGTSAAKEQSITSLTGIYNNTMVSVENLISAGTSNYVSELSMDDPENIEALRTQFFSDGTDFVKQMTDADGSLIMMYGVGQKILKISTSGILSYTEELNEDNYHSCGFYKSLGFAKKFLERHNGSGDLSNLNLYITNVETIKDGDYSGYRIDFGAVFGGLDIMYQNEALMSVDVYGSQVTRYSRDLPDVSNITALDEASAAIDAMELIRANCDLIAAIIMENYADSSSINTEKYTANDNYYAVTTSISKAHLSMVRLDAGSVENTNDANEEDDSDKENVLAASSQLLAPAWFIQVDGVNFWFSIDEGKLLSYSIN